MTNLTSTDFEPIRHAQEIQGISRPSLSYWRDAWIRLKANKRAISSLFLVIGLLLFTIVGPIVWNVDPALQDLDQVGQPPGSGRLAVIVNEYEPWAGESEAIGTGLRLAENATTMAVRLKWDNLSSAVGYRIYRNISPLGRSEHTEFHWQNILIILYCILKIVSILSQGVTTIR